MKIAVSTNGKSLESEFNPRFGRTAGFILYDTETGNYSYLDNSEQQNLSQGAGIKAAQMITEAGTEVLIIGQMGPKAAHVFQHTKIKIYIFNNGTVKEAIQAFEQNKLREFSSNDIQAVSGKMGGRGMGGGGRGMGRGQGAM